MISTPGADADAIGPAVRHLRAVLRRQRLVVLGVLLSVLALALLLVRLQTPAYAASARIAVEPPASPVGGELERLVFGTVDIPTQSQILGSATVVRAALEAQDLPADEAAAQTFLDKGVTAVAVGSTSVLEVTVTDPNPQRAAALAQEIAEQYVQLRSSEAAARIARVTAELEAEQRATRADLVAVREQLTAARPEVRSSLEEEVDDLQSELRALAGRIVEIQAQAPFAQRSTIIQSAVVPKDPVSPSPLLAYVLAVLIGTGLGVAAAFLVDARRQRVWGRYEVEAAGAAPLLATLSSAGPGSSAADAPGTDVTGDDYRRLQVALGASTPFGSPLRLVLVPVGRGADAAVVTAALGAALTEGGRSVLLVDGDARRSTLTRLLGVEGRPGLGDLVAGQEQVDRVLTQPRGCGFRMFPAGTPQAGAGPASSAAALRQLLLSPEVEGADVLVVVPPVDEHVDGLEVAQGVGIALLVADQRRTTRSELRAAVEELRAADVHVRGSVLGPVAGPATSAGGASRQAGPSPQGESAPTVVA